MASPSPVIVTNAGAQPVIDYLTKDYAGFRQGMLNQIPLLMPQWTDRSEADFGVVLIELMAYVADILSYYQDRVANEAFLASATQRRSVADLLRLIDYQIDPGLAASALIHVDVSADVTVTGAGLPYRLKTAGVPGQPDVTFEVTEAFALKALNNAIDLAALASLPVGSTALVVPRTSHALADGHIVYFEERTVDPDGTTRVRRSPQLAVTAVRDAGLGKDEIRWLPPLPEPFLPSLTKLKGNNVVATHGTTIADEPTFVGDGTPGQSFTLSRVPVTHRLRPQPSQRLRSQPALAVRVDGVLWERVDSLIASLPSDTHYTTTIDENDFLTITFGTGLRGSVPPAGSQVTATYRIGLGSGGNVGADTLSVFVSTVPEVKTITNPFPAAGGADRESTEEAKISGPGSVIAQERAVTLLDYELLAEAFPGIGKAKARVGLRGGYKVVQVFVAPEDPQTVPPPLPSDELKEALEGHLHSRMPVNRMAGVDVLDPVYVPVDVTVDVHVKGEASQSAVFQSVQSALRDLLSFARQDFGRPVRVGEVFATLYPLEGISHALLRRLARSGAAPVPGAACDFEDVTIAEHELAFAGVITINLIGGVR
jgi:Baseplate J-like protein